MRTQGGQPAFYNAHILFNDLKNRFDISDIVTQKISFAQKERAMYEPLPMRTLLIDDCIDAQTEYNSGGARYKRSERNLRKRNLGR